MSASTLPFIQKPAPWDVLCSQDANLSQHKGNQILRYLIDKTVESYRQAKNRPDKVAKIDGIIKFMQEHYQSRFLRRKLDEGGLLSLGWEEIHGQNVRDKVSHALRFAAKQPKGNKKTNKARRGSMRSRSVQMNETTNSVEDGDFLDEKVQARLESIHRRQQEILRSMLAENDEDSTMTFDSTSATSVANSSLPSLVSACTSTGSDCNYLSVISNAGTENTNGSCLIGEGHGYLHPYIEDQDPFHENMFGNRRHDKYNKSTDSGPSTEACFGESLPRYELRADNHFTYGQQPYHGQPIAVFPLPFPQS